MSDIEPYKPEPGVVEGLEDFDQSERVMPTLRIDHDEAKFVDSLSGQEWETLKCVILGRIRQRVLWPATVGDEKQYPLCRSYNYDEGHPAEDFPWEASGFEEQTGTLPCENCKLQEWNSHPTREAPWCSEQHTFAALVVTDDDDYIPVLLQVQRSGLKPARTYLSSFANESKPLFTVYTEIKLEAKKRGKNNYAVPKFRRLEQTDQDEHAHFSTTYRGIRTFLQTPRVFGDGDDGAEVTETPVSAPSTASAPAAARTSPMGGSTAAAAPAASSAGDDEELPF